MNNNRARISPQRAQILFALADTNNDGQLNMQEISQLFDRILLGAQIDPINNYQGFGAVIQPGWDPAITIDLPEFTNSIITWATTMAQNINSAPIGTYFILIDGNTITSHQAGDRIQWVINHMDFEQAPVIPVDQEVVDPVQQDQDMPIAQEVVNPDQKNISHLPIAHIEPSLPIAHIEPSLPPPPIPSNEDDVALCPICISPITGPAFEDITANPPGNELLACGHVFHKHCLDAMRNATNNLKCPLCRTPFVGGRRTFKKSSQKTKKNKRKLPFSKKGKKRKTRQKRKTRRGRK